MNVRAIPVAIVFAVTYSIVYFLAVWHNYALFTYHPVLGEVAWGVEKSRDGPAMYWYGWMSTAALSAIAASVVACLLPASLLQRLWSGWTWVVASGVLVLIAYMLRNYFLR